MNRRQFIQSAIALGIAPAIASIAWAQSGGIRVRRSATNAGGDLDTYERAIRIMRDLSDEDYFSWGYWSNIHGMRGRAPDEYRQVWEQCRHRTEDFLFWHRAYLVFFEAAIQEVTGDRGFALPYWDWYADPEIPGAFQRGPLEHRRRYERRTLEDTWSGERDFRRMTAELEGNPHGTVHVMVGRDMGRVQTAGLDPLFYCHHSQVDRLWAIWQARGGESGGGGRVYTFDTAGARSLAASELISTERLGYRYDSMAQPVAAKSAPIDTVVRVPVVIMEGSGMESALWIDGLRLTKEGKRQGVDFSVLLGSTRIGNVNSFDLSSHGGGGTMTFPVPRDLGRRYARQESAPVQLASDAGGLRGLIRYRGMRLVVRAE